MTAFMIDLDGTIYKGGNPIPGAKEFIETLQEKKIPFVFLTNNSSSSREHYLNKLTSMGFKISLDNVLTSTTATVMYIQKFHPNAKVFPLGTPEFVKEVVDHGIPISENDPDIVLLAFDKTITYDKINLAYHHLMKGCELIATHPDDLCPTENGYDVDIGPFIRMFESLTGRKATVIGKPNPLMIEMAASAMDARHKEMIMVGDRLYTDMRMAADAGIGSILVLSGETSEEDLLASPLRPTFVLPSVASIPNVLDEM